MCVWVSLPHEPPSPHPNPTLEVIAEHQAELPVLYSNFILAIYFTYGSMYMSMLHSQFVPYFSSPAVFTSLFSMSVSLCVSFK